MLYLTTSFLFFIAQLHFICCQTSSPSSSSASSSSSINANRDISYVIHTFNVAKSLALQHTSATANVPPLFEWKQGYNLTFSTSSDGSNLSAAAAAPISIACSLHDAWSPEGNADDEVQKAIASSAMSCNESAVNVTIQRDKMSPERGFYLFLDTE